MPILDKIAFSNLSIMKIWYDDNEMKEILGNQEKKRNYLCYYEHFFALLELELEITSNTSISILYEVNLL